MKTAVSPSKSISSEIYVETVTHISADITEKVRKVHKRSKTPKTDSGITSGAGWSVLNVVLIPPSLTEHLTDFEESINLEEIEAKPAQEKYEIDK